MSDLTRKQEIYSGKSRESLYKPTAADRDAIFLLRRGALSSYEDGFLKSLERLAAWTPKQARFFASLKHQYLKGP